MRTPAADYPCDVLVFATGFDAMTGAMTRIDPVGPGGQRLQRSGRDGPLTFLGLMVPRLPNLFSFGGPGSPSVLANMVLHAEVQVDWALDLMIRPPGRDQRGRAAWRRCADMDGACRRGRGHHAVSEGAVVLVSRRQHRRQETGLHAVCRRIRQLPQVSG